MVWEGGDGGRRKEAKDRRLCGVAVRRHSGQRGDNVGLNGPP